MSKVLLINPNKWGRGITHIWIPTHTSVLQDAGHEVKLFDCSFYADWTVNEVAFNTDNEMYKKSDYDKKVKYNQNDVIEDLQKFIDDFKPDFLFWSALSSHIHGEGEYVNIQYGYSLIESINTTAKKVTGGLQVTGELTDIYNHFKNVDYFIAGESEIALRELIDNILGEGRIKDVRGIIYKDKNDKVVMNDRQQIIEDLNIIPPYDYSVFDDQVFLRPYNGRVVRAVDYELSRGCIYACEYCVETVIQSYYGFDEVVPGSGTIRNPRKYLRHKTAERIFFEMSQLHNELGIELFRCQDTNFLTIDKATLNELSDMISNSNLKIILYIETRPEGINNSSLKLLKKLKVDGVGMGVEVSTQDFREEKLKRFANQEKIIKAFKLLRENGIKRTAYNIIGLPDQDESSILDTIRFNRLLQPDNMTVAFYSPYIGTAQQQRGNELGYFDDYEYHVDSALRSLSQHSLVNVEKLKFYKKNFVNFVNNGIQKNK
tara:strand:- start:2402 stop:3865 length:1464 start_codon:yes stop_codon:yes gene_type:complete